MERWLAHLAGETQTKLLALLRRGPHTIDSLARALNLTDNAVRSHIAVLSGHGIVADVGAQRDTGGKPARLYALSAQGAEIFPKAYAPVLKGLIAEIARRHGSKRASDLVRAIGTDLAAGAKATGVNAAADFLRSLGGDVDVERTADGWRLQGYACPLSAVTRDHPEACELARTLVEEIAGAPVTECCQRGPLPRCGFSIESKA